MNKNIAGVIVLVCLIWGYLWVPIKIGLEYLPPFLFSAVRLIIGACVLIVLQLFLRKSIFPKKERVDEPIYFKSINVCRILRSIYFWNAICRFRLIICVSLYNAHHDLCPCTFLSK